MEVLESKQVSKGNGLRFVAIITTLVGIFTPGAYLIGLTYYQGYLSAFGMSSELFPLSAQAAYVHFYTASALYVIDFFGLVVNQTWIFGWFILAAISWIIFFLILGVVLGLTIACLEQTSLYKKVSTKLDLPTLDEGHVRKMGSGAFTVFSYTYILFVVMLLWVLIPYLAHQKGIEVAGRERDHYLHVGCDAQEKSSVFGYCRILLSPDNKEFFQGYLVIQNEKYLGFFLEKGTYIMPRPNGSILINRVVPIESKESN